jgi:hypothetical protein
MYATIDFSKDAKELCLWKEICLKIFIKDEDGNIIEELPYNSYNMEKVKELMIPIIENPDIPECRKFPEKMLLLGRILWRKRKW